MGRWLLALAVAGCYGPSLREGDGGETSRLDAPLDGGDGGVVDAIDGAPPPDGVTFVDASPCPLAANDTPLAAQDVGAGGDFCVSLAGVADDVDVPCGENTGRDLFFELTLGGPEVVYFDTFGSTGQMVVALIPAPCDGTGTVTACAGASCSAGAQLALSLPPGTYCVIVDEWSNGGSNDDARLRVIRGGADGLPLPASGTMVNQYTCGLRDLAQSSACGAATAAPELRLFFAQCPGASRTIRAAMEGCSPVSSTYEIYERQGEIGSADSGTCNELPCGVPSVVDLTFPGEGLHWLVVDNRTATDCGQVNLTPTYP